VFVIHSFAHKFGSHIIYVVGRCSGKLTAMEYVAHCQTLTDSGILTNLA